MERLADEGAEDHDSDGDEQKGDYVGHGLCGDEAFENGCQRRVIPGGEQDSGDQAAEREEFEQEAAQEGQRWWTRRGWRSETSRSSSGS